jgi:hypothetical protein
MIRLLMALLLAVLILTPDATIRSDLTWSSGLELQRTGAFGIEEALGYTINAAMFTSTHPLLKDNCVGLTFETLLTPVTIMERLSLSISPVAFWEIGGSVDGSYGWRVWDIYGTGINGPSGEHYKSGFVYQSNVYNLLQIETKDLFQNEKLNFQAAVIERFAQKKFSAAMPGQSWIFQDDEGENFNGWSWEQVFFAGYKYPIVKRWALLVGSMITTTLDLTNRYESTISGGGWGSDFITAHICPLVNLQYSKNLEITALLKFRKTRIYKDTPGSTYFAEQHFDRSEYRYNRVQVQVKYSFGKKNW